MTNAKTQTSLFFFQNPNSGCPMVLRNHYGEYRVVVESGVLDDAPAESDQDDAADYTKIVAKAQDDDHAVFALRTALGLDADGDAR